MRRREALNPEFIIFKENEIRLINRSYGCKYMIPYTPLEFAYLLAYDRK